METPTKTAVSYDMRESKINPFIEFDFPKVKGKRVKDD